MKTIALIVASGRGKRMRNSYSVPKQYLPLGKSNVLRETILKFKNHVKIDNVLCVIHPEDLSLYNESIYDFEVLNPVFGGNTRNDSIREGLKALF